MTKKVATASRAAPKAAPTKARTPLAAPKTKAKPVPRPARRPQAERSATTRAKVIEAAIKCLHRSGYRLTTTTAVAQEAGVSRGAMMHHFASKGELMLAVVRSVFESDSERTIRSVALSSPLEWMRTLPSTIWESISRPSGIAVMEIMLASRSEPELVDQLRELQLQIDREAHGWIVERHAAAGLKERPDGEAIHRLFVAALRGLALEAIFMRNRVEVEKSIAVLGEVLTQFYPKLKKLNRP